jgi:hypothetical protein
MSCNDGCRADLLPEKVLIKCLGVCHDREVGPSLPMHLQPAEAALTVVVVDAC